MGRGGIGRGWGLRGPERGDAELVGMLLGRVSPSWFGLGESDGVLSGDECHRGPIINTSS